MPVNKRQQKRFDRLASQCKTPQAGPAKSPAHGPQPIDRVPAPFETLAGVILTRVATAAAVPGAGNPFEITKRLAASSRSTFLMIERARFRHGCSPESAATAVVVRWGRRPDCARRLPSGLGGDGDVEAIARGPPLSLSTIAAHAPPELLLLAAGAVLRIGRSMVLPPKRAGEPSAVAADWVASLLSAGRLSLSQRLPGSGRTLLHLALELGDKALATRLVNAATGPATTDEAADVAFDPLVCDARKRTALHVAAAAGFADVCLLIVRVTDPSRVPALAAAVDASKNTAVDAATRAHHTKVAATLGDALRVYDDDDDGDGDYYYDGDDGEGY